MTVSEQSRDLPTSAPTFAIPVLSAAPTVQSSATRSAVPTAAATVARTNTSPSQSSLVRVRIRQVYHQSEFI